MATKKKSTPTLVDHTTRDYNISTTLVPDDKWTFRWNGDLVTKVEYDTLSKEHEKWIKQQDVHVDEPVKKTRKNK